MTYNPNPDAPSLNKKVTFTADVDMTITNNLNTFNNDLWLEKYKPKKYDELLTDEKTNRDVLTWLKSWDEQVFKVMLFSLYL